MANPQIDNLIYSIAARTDTPIDVVYQATQRIAEYYHIECDAAFLERLYLWIADGQESRAMVFQFRHFVADIKDEQASAPESEGGNG